MIFENEKQDRDKRIQSLIKELTNLQIQNREERVKVETLENKEADGLQAKDKLIADMHSLDQQLHSQAKESNHQDQDLIILKLAKDHEDMSKHQKKIEDETSGFIQQFKILTDSNSLLQISTTNLEQKMDGLNFNEGQIDHLQNQLIQSMQNEKKYFDENLQLLVQLREIEEQLQQQQNNQSEKQDKMNLIISQNQLESKHRDISKLSKQLVTSYNLQLKKLNEIKWVIEKYFSVCVDPDLRKMVSLDTLKLKFVKTEQDFEKYFEQLTLMQQQIDKIESEIREVDIEQTSEPALKALQQAIQSLEFQIQQHSSKSEDMLDLFKLSNCMRETENAIDKQFGSRFQHFKDTQSKSISNQLITQIEDLLKPDEDLFSKIKSTLWELEENDLQDNENLKLYYLKQIEENTDLLNSEVKAFYQLQFIQSLKNLVQKQERTLSIKSKLKKASDSIQNLDKSIQENENTLDFILKEGSYLKESEFSPIKGRQSIIYGSKGDLEKEQEIFEQNKQMDLAMSQHESLSSEKDKLKKLLRQYQQKFDDLDLEVGTIITFEELIDDISNDLDYKVQELKNQSINQMNNDIKQLKEDVENRSEKFKTKRQVLSQCKAEEKEKREEIWKTENMLVKLQDKFDKIEKVVKGQQGFNMSQDIKIQFNQHIQDLSTLRQQLTQIEKENNKQKVFIGNVSGELNSLGDKLITLEDLQQMLVQLQSMNKIKSLQDQMKQIGQQLSDKEISIDQYIKDLLGSSTFDCELKFKEADQIIEKITKMMNVINNSMNDFELDIKKGYQLYPTNPEISKEGKKLSDENIKARKQLKKLDEQKSTLRKVLHKIKSTLNERESQNISPQKISAQTMEDFIQEIGTCIQKAEYLDKQLPELSQNLEERKEEWMKILILTDSRKQLVDEITKNVKANESQQDIINQKISQIEKLSKGLEEVSKNMLQNPDYILRKPQIVKTIEQLKVLNTQKADLQSQLKKIEGNTIQMQESLEKINDLSVDQLTEIAKLGQVNNEGLKKENKSADIILKNLNKKRQKLADADILDNFKDRIDVMNEIDLKVKLIQKDQEELEKIIQETSKFNPAAISEAMNQLKDIKLEIEATNKAKAQEMELLQKLKEQIKNKDLSVDDPATFSQIMNGIAELKAKLSTRDSHLANLSKKIKFLKNKYGSADVKKQFEQFKLRGTDHGGLLEKIAQDLQALKILQEDFDGYTSDDQEEDFIERLGHENKEMNERYNQALESNVSMLECIENIKKDLDKWNQEEVDVKEIERRAKIISEIEDEIYQNYRQVDDLDHKLERNKKVFLSMQIQQKLKRREQEVVELQKRINQFEEFAFQLENDISNELNSISQSNSNEQLYETLAEIGNQVVQNKEDYQKIAQNLKKIFIDVEQLKESKSHIFDLLKANIWTKKDTLENLHKVKQLRQVYVTLKAKFDSSKPKKKIAYKPIKGDYVDQLLAEWINNNNCPVPISRLGNGFYMFGTKKIFAKIINGKLVIRVGGGYMGIDEFMFYYGAQELNKMLAYEDLDGDEEIDFNDVVEENKTDVLKQFHNGKTVIGSQAFRKRLSPRPGAMSGRGYSPRQQK